MTDTLIAAAQIAPKSLVLDLAAGSGDPSLEIARRFPAASILAVDRSSAGLELARRSSVQSGYGSRMAFLQADVHAIPIESGRIDRVTCKFGVMFFARVDRSLTEILRVLRPGGRTALMAWGTIEQPVFAATIGTVLQFMPGTAIPEDLHAVHRFATPGSLANELRNVGFRNVQETPAKVLRHWTGSAEELWTYQQEVSTPWRAVLNAIPASLRPEVDSAVIANLEQFREPDRFVVPVQVTLATGEK